MQVLLSVETEETQLGSLGDQVSSYLYYTRYTERPTTDATWNTPIVRYESLRCRYESLRVMQTTSHNESVFNESLRVRYERESLRVIRIPEMSVHILY